MHGNAAKPYTSVDNPNKSEIRINTSSVTKCCEPLQRAVAILTIFWRPDSGFPPALLLYFPRSPSPSWSSPPSSPLPSPSPSWLSPPSSGCLSYSPPLASPALPRINFHSAHCFHSAFNFICNQSKLLPSLSFAVCPGVFPPEELNSLIFLPV